MGYRADSPGHCHSEGFPACFKSDDSSLAEGAQRGTVPAMAHRFGVEETDTESGIRVIAVTGELDLAVADRVREAIDRAAKAPGVLVDLSACEFLDSTGIAVLIRGREALAAEGRELAICNPRSQVLRVLEVTGLTRLDGFLADPPPDPVVPLAASRDDPS
jgi:anti-anti-sigma factor